MSNMVEALIWDTSIQGTPLFKGHKIWSQKNVHIIFVFVICDLFKGQLYSGERDTFFWVPKPRFNLHSGDTFVVKT